MATSVETLIRKSSKNMHKRRKYQSFNSFALTLVEALKKPEVGGKGNVPVRLGLKYRNSERYQFLLISSQNQFVSLPEVEPELNADLRVILIGPTFFVANKTGCFGIVPKFDSYSEG